MKTDRQRSCQYCHAEFYAKQAQRGFGWCCPAHCYVDKRRRARQSALRKKLWRDSGYRTRNLAARTQRRDAMGRFSD